MTIDGQIRRSIENKLCEIEQQENVRVIYAAESGSRAWGFASPDSDYDVRFIYVRRPQAYLRLESTPDVIEWQLDEVYDINGWDIKKLLTLVHKSNQTIFEWAQSPVVYRTTPLWDKVLPVLREYFDPKGGLYHYLGMTRADIKCMDGERVRQKRYLYVLRALLACLWICDRKTPPPILFDELKAAYLPTDLLPVTEKLLQEKMSAPESREVTRIEVIHGFIDRTFPEMEQAAASMESGKNDSWESLDRIFLEAVLGE